MTVRTYFSTDTSAPVLANTAGSMIAVLDACLVNGYGSKSAAGWTKPFSGTNLAVYRNNTSVSGSSGMYLRVNDTVTSSAAVRAYKTMSDINTGTDVTPNTAMLGQTDIFWYKHYTGTTTPKRWAIFADERTFYMNVYPYNSFPSDNIDYSQIMGAGDYESYVPGNDWNYFVFGNGGTGATSARFPASGSTGTYNIALGRGEALAVDTPFPGFVECVRTSPGGSAHLPFSIYTGLRYFQRPYVGAIAPSSTIMGEFRGCMYHVGQGVPAWMENFGKLPSDPTGPDLYQFVTAASATSMYGTLLVKESDW